MFKEQLLEGLSQIGLTYDDETLTRLELFAELLKKWNKIYNLTAIQNDRDILTHHLLDSAAFVPYVQKVCPLAQTVLDVGSGGGLPAIPLAIFRPDLKVAAVDAVAKKTAFLTQASIQLKLNNFSAHHARVEKLLGVYDVIMSRAFASLKDFTEWTEHLLPSTGYWLAMKGVFPEEEVKALPSYVKVVDVFTMNVPQLVEERHLVVMQKL